ncbi:MULTISPECIES: class 1 fructose-bisphosphatase [unclassified Sinorhizobium]|uniref:class 1 fructose-bisphosphatase n=1 Tax=unclassified Sinorhizobium TaxID=2613772 RepID=UPI0024C3ADC5|nr:MULTISPECIES: class 1 fructose-bisphosphatase [unclassified Sinorhizobium]MDK1377846.1 class 1 fructose-bisphosphatase [Sinorhizobium sp. 6-70]MDK1479879.1 class 1 fructose-bisphosphatase [Sinorhizobium sp. 6-117]
MSGATLEAYLASRTANGDDLAPDVAAVIQRLATAALVVRKIINQGALDTAFNGSRGDSNADGDLQRNLDVLCNELFLSCLQGAPVAYYASEELEKPVALDPAARLAVAIDPLDGSSNIDNNVSIGTVFSVLPAIKGPDLDPTQSFLQPGNQQLAAGFFVYGPQTTLVLSLGKGTEIFIFSNRLGCFVEAYKSVGIPERTSEFAINMSNYRHWEEAIRLYVDDCLAGSEGPRERDFNMRWIASLVAEAYRILVCGGIFLYPADGRKGYGQGRLRLVYEANPIAFIVENAGGAATNSITRILDLVPESLHQRVPLAFGSRREVARVARYHVDPNMIGERAPLFGKRGLFRA